MRTAPSVLCIGLATCAAAQETKIVGVGAATCAHFNAQTANSPPSERDDLAWA